MRFLRNAVLAVAISAAGAASAGSGKLVVTGGIQNLRAEPGWWGEITALAQSGSSVDILARSDGWVLVQHESGSVGWMEPNRLAAPARRTAPVSSPKPAAKPAVEPVPGGKYLSVVYTDGSLNLREGPGTGYGIVAPMQRGSFVEVQAKAGDWVRLRHESGAEGWAYRKYLTR